MRGEGARLANALDAHRLCLLAVVHERAWVGDAAALGDSCQIHVGIGAQVGAGAVVTRDVYRAQSSQVYRPEVGSGSGSNA